MSPKGVQVPLIETIVLMSRCSIRYSHPNIKDKCDGGFGDRFEASGSRDF